jgi:hypothetical protein
VPMPAQQGRRPDQERRPPDAWQHAARRCQKQSIGRLQSRPPALTAQDSQLMAQDDDFEFLELSRPAQKANEL